MKNTINPKDKITLDVPLFIRLLEYAREDVKTDMDLHNVAEKAIELSMTGATLTMTDYDKIVNMIGDDTLQERMKYMAGIVK